jgi:methylmalonyl-CoA mutase cobalamin-binding subunit
VTWRWRRGASRCSTTRRSTGSDAHTVGIDAILNYKGFAGEKGLESYKCFDAHNLGAQVENVEFAERAKALGADAILVSQVITQRNCHKENAAALIDLLQKQGVRDKFLLLLGGPRIDNKLALELGYEGGFGPGTKPSMVAAFVAEQSCAAPRERRSIRGGRGRSASRFASMGSEGWRAPWITTVLRALPQNRAATRALPDNRRI